MASQLPIIWWEPHWTYFGSRDEFMPCVSNGPHQTSCSWSVAYMSGETAIWKEDHSLLLCTLAHTTRSRNSSRRSMLTNTMGVNSRHAMRNGRREAGTYIFFLPSFCSWCVTQAFSRSRMSMTLTTTLGTKSGLIDMMRVSSRGLWLLCNMVWIQTVHASVTASNGLGPHTY